MQRWKSCLLLLSGIAMLSACGNSGTSTTNSLTQTALTPTTFYTHNAVFLNNTSVYTWGSNESGQLGNNSNSYSNVPVRVHLFGSVVDGVAVGSNHTLAFRNLSTVRAWGFNGYGQLGNGVTADNQTPNKLVPVAVRKTKSTDSLTGVVAVAAGGYHSLALDKDGKVWSWGSNSFSQLGRGIRFASISTQVADKVWLDVNGSPLGSIIAIAAGGSHSLAVMNDNSVFAWGYNASGQLGQGNTIYYPYPVKVSGQPPLPAIVKVAAGGSHSLALASDGTLWAWGYNYFGQLGDGTTTDKSRPVQVKIDSATPLIGITMIAAGLNHSLAYDSVNDKLYVWGTNLFGQLGRDSASMQITEGNTPYTSRPIMISNFSQSLIAGTRLQSLSAAGQHSHASISDLYWWSWGDNSIGQLGIGTTTNSSTPVRVRGF